MKNENYQETNIITKVIKGKDYYTISQDGMCCVLEKIYGIKPKVGDKLTVHTKGGMFGTIRGMDLNGKQIDGTTDEVLAMGSVKAKFEAFDWIVLEIKEGNNIDAIKAGLTEAKSKSGNGKPVCILLHTEMGNGVDFMMHTHAWHGKAPNDEQLAKGLAQNVETLGDY